MKKKYFSFLILPSILLSSCTFLLTKQTIEKEINVYDIDKLDKNGALASGYQTTLNARFIQGQDYVPFITLEQYASLYKPHLAQEFTSTVENSLTSSIWTVKKGESVYFVAELSHLMNSFSVAGSLEATYAPSDDPRDLKALEYGLNTTADGKYLSDKTYATFDFGSYNISHFSYNGEKYYPLGLFDITFSDSSAIYFTYNYEHILSTRDTDNYSSLIYYDNQREYTFDSQMSFNRRSELVMPSYLRELNAHLFMYLMDNFYGLKEQKGIKSMVKYYKNNHNIYASLISSIGSERAQAYSDALSILDDNHTILYSVNDTWGEDYYIGRRYGEGIDNRNKTREALKAYRANAYANYGGYVQEGNDILYSNDGKTALFSFDSFTFGPSEYVFNPDNSIKSTAKEYDTYFKLIDVLDTIKSKGGVENVILDISINGGGVVGVMMKLLALISKDNDGGISFYDDTIDQVSFYHAQVDRNGDEQYDPSDCYGNDFDFYILTSDCSFSCGNAFPCMAQINNTAKIIGQKSGGGECAVSIHYLPNSQYVYHSSNLHLGNFDEGKNTFTGFESGATPDIPLAINENFYSIESLNTAIKNAK